MCVLKSVFCFSPAGNAQSLQLISKSLKVKNLPLSVSVMLVTGPIGLLLCRAKLGSSQKKNKYRSVHYLCINSQQGTKKTKFTPKIKNTYYLSVYFYLQPYESFCYLFFGSVLFFVVSCKVLKASAAEMSAIS